MPGRLTCSCSNVLRGFTSGVDAHISPPLRSPLKPNSPLRLLAASFAALMYPMPYPMSQAPRALAEKRTQ